VNTVPLADYIAGPIDYLKLDMKSLEPHLHLVRAVGLEFHGTGRQASADKEDLIRLLHESRFQISITHKPRSIFPSEINAWVERVQPYVSMIKATRV
jgi:hypothetical protein